MRRRAVRGGDRPRAHHGLQLLALLQARLDHGVHAAENFTLLQRRRQPDRIQVQPRGHRPPVLPRLRDRAVRARHATGRSAEMVAINVRCLDGVDPSRAAAHPCSTARAARETSMPASHFPRRLCRDVRPDRRRQGPPRRHRADRRGRAGLHHLRRGGEVRRRQGDPRRHGPEPDRPRRGRRRHRHHQRADHRPLGHRQGRHRHQGRQDRRHRQGRQPGRPAGRRHHRRPRHRGDRRRGQDHHRRRPRHAHPLHLPAADRRGADVGRDHHARRRHRPGDRHQRHHLHARARGTSAA